MTQLRNQKVGTTFLPSINGLRGIAVLMVVLYHWSHIRGGFTGVDIFFVISGYLITGPIVRELGEGRFSFLRFYAKRTRRIIPCLAVILLFSLCVGWLWSFGGQFRLLGRHIQSGALFLSNFRLYGESGYFDAAAETKPLLHLWSLGIEEQFYLVWPLFLWAAFKTRWRVDGIVLGTAILSFLASLYLSGHHPEMDFYLLPSRLWELASGYLVRATTSRARFRAFYSSRLAQFTGLFLILFGCVAIHGQSGFPGMTALIPVVGAGLLLGSSEDGPVSRKLLGSRWLGFFGTISYPLYLWHWTLFSFMKCLMLNDEMVAVALGSFLLAWLTHFFVERPFMSLPVTPENRLGIVAAGVAALSVIAIAGTLVGNGTIHGRMLTSSLPDPVDLRSGLDCGIDASYGHIFSPEMLKSCDLRPFPGAPVILLVGDSHAGSLNDGMDAFARRNHLNLVTFTAQYCTPLSLRDRRPACRDFNRYVESWASTRKPDLIVLEAYHRYWSDNHEYGEPEPYPKYLVSRLREFERLTGKKVLLVGQNPTWHVSLPRVLNIAFLARGIPVPERTDQGIVRNALEYDQVMKREAERQGIPYFSIKDEICTSEGCRVRVGNHLESDLMEFDYGHLSHQGSLYVVGHGLGARMKSLLMSDAEPR